MRAAVALFLQINHRHLASAGEIPHRLVHGSITNALLQAVDAQSAYPDREVISMWGDGGFSMMMGDFFSLTQLGLSVKVTVPNNGLLGFVELEMKARSFLDPGCDLKNPNFALMARAMGDRAFPVAKPAQKLKSVTEAAFAQKVPAPLDVMSARQELAMPPKMALDQAYHFGIFTMKAVLVGRVAELIDLAGVNFTR